MGLMARSGPGARNEQVSIFQVQLCLEAGGVVEARVYVRVVAKTSCSRSSQIYRCPHVQLPHYDLHAAVIDLSAQKTVVLCLHLSRSTSSVTDE